MRYYLIILFACHALLGFSQNTANVSIHIKNSLPQTLKIYAVNDEGDYDFLQEVKLTKKPFEVIEHTFHFKRDEIAVKFLFSKYDFGGSPVLGKGDSMVIKTDFADTIHIASNTTFSGSARTTELHNSFDRASYLSRVYNKINDDYVRAAINGSRDTAKFLLQRDSVHRLRIAHKKNVTLNTQSATVASYGIASTSSLNFNFTRDEYNILRKRFADYPLLIKAIENYESQPDKAGVYTKTRYNGIELNTNAGNFTLPDINNKPRSLNNYKGKYILVDLWASWCAPCREQAPYLKDVLQRFGKKGLVIISISVDEDHKKWLNAIKADGTGSFVHLIDDKGWKASVIKRYKVTGLPTNFLVGPNGNIIDEGLYGSELIVKLNNIFKNIKP